MPGLRTGNGAGRLIGNRNPCTFPARFAFILFHVKQFEKAG